MRELYLPIFVLVLCQIVGTVSHDFGSAGGTSFIPFGLAVVFFPALTVYACTFL